MTDRHVGSGQTYATIQAAINASSDNDKIIVHAGEYFEVLRINKKLTIEAYGTDEPYVTGRVDLPGYDSGLPSNALPPGDNWTGNLSDGYGYKWAALVNFVNGGAYSTWDGIEITRSSGRGITIGQDNPVVNVDHVTIKNTTISHCRSAAIVPYYSTHATLQNCIFDDCVNFYANRPWSLHQGAVGGPGASYLTIEDCHWIECQGENLMFDFNVGGAHDLIVRRCTIRNGRQYAVYLHDTHSILFEECIFYGSTEAFYVPSPHYQWAGFTIKGVESQYFKKGANIKFGGVSDVEVRNCIFVNMSENVLFGGITDYNIAVDNVVFHGCTFVHTMGRSLVRVATAGTSSSPYTNILFKGNAFYTTGNAANVYTGWGGKSHLDVDWVNNGFNKTPPAPCIDGDNIISTNGGGDFNFGNPTHAFLKNTFNADDYKIASNSGVLIGELIAPPTYDIDGNARSVPSDLGAHDESSSSVTPPADAPPTAAFTMKVSAVEITEIELGTEVTFDDDSTPGSGKTITDTDWEIDLPGTTENYTSALGTFTYEPLALGIYTVRLDVTQSDSQVAQITKTLRVVEVYVSPPPPEPTGGDCGLEVWTNAIKNGTPDFANTDGVRSISCASGEAGHTFSYWKYATTPATSIKLSIVYRTSITSGNASLLAHYYNSSGTWLSAISTALTPQTTDTAYSRVDTVPTNAVRVRFEMRMWSTVGTVWFSEPCVVLNTALSAPEAKITATVGGSSISTADIIVPSTVIAFSGTTSTGTSLTYAWTLFDSQMRRLVIGEGGTSSTLSQSFGSVGIYYMELEVTQSDGQVHGTTFVVDVQDIADQGYVWVEKETDSLPGLTTSPVVGFAPMQLRCIAFTSSLDLASRVGTYQWEILDSSGSPLIVVQGGSEYSVLLPLAVDPDETLYGIRMTMTTLTGTEFVHVEYATVELTVRDIDLIGPTMPTTISHDSGNIITEQNTHSHEVELSSDGAPRAITQFNTSGGLFPQYLAAGWDVFTGAVNSALGRGIPYSLSLLGGIIFKDRGLISAQSLELNVSELTVPKLPTVDPPGVRAVWVDSNGFLKISSGTVYEEPELSTSEISLIASGNDDGAETTFGVVVLDGNTIRVNSEYTRAAFRFLDIDIAGTATILGATLKVFVNSNGLTYNADIAMEAHDDSPALSTTTDDLTDRSITTQNAEIRETASYGFYTVTLSAAAIQAVIDRAGWSSGNAMTVILDAVTGSNLAILSYDYTSNNAATLTIEYE